MAAIKQKLIRLVDGLECTSKKVQMKLDDASSMLKEKDTVIPEDQAGRNSVYEFLFKLFTNYPQTMTAKNYHQLETFIEQLEKTPAPRTGKGRTR